MKKYNLQTKRGVANILEDVHDLYSDRFYDLEIVNLLIDVNLAIRKAGLSKEEAETLHLRYEKQMKIDEVAKKLQVKEDTVKFNIDNGIKKIAKVFRDWDY